jgi:hypothetical protein
MARFGSVAIAVALIAAPAFAQGYDPTRAQAHDQQEAWNDQLAILGLNTRRCMDGYVAQYVRGRAVLHQRFTSSDVVDAATERCANGYLVNSVLHHYRTRAQAEGEVRTWALRAYADELSKGQ